MKTGVFTYKYYDVGNVRRLVPHPTPAAPFNNGKTFLDKTWTGT